MVVACVSCIRARADRKGMLGHSPCLGVCGWSQDVCAIARALCEGVERGCRRFVPFELHPPTFLGAIHLDLVWNMFYGSNGANQVLPTSFSYCMIARSVKWRVFF